MSETNFIEKYDLTDREIDITQYISMGLTNDEIAKRLSISKFTVQRHLQNIFEKTGARNRTELARLFYHPNVN